LSQLATPAGSSFRHCYQVTGNISEEIRRPVSDIPEGVKLQGVQGRPVDSGFAEVERYVVISQLLLGDSALQTVEEVLGVALDDELNFAVLTVLARMNSLDEQVRHFGLYRGVEM
jgi:cobyrinic acid a,c-diamide synthase